MPSRMVGADLRLSRRWHARRVFVLMLWLGGAGLIVSCGTVGPIVAPEDIGVNAKRQKDLVEKERLQREAQFRKEQEEGRASLPGGETAAEPPTTEDEQKEEAPTPVPGKIVNPGARPTGDVFVMPR